MKIILALDLGAKTGWALGRHEGLRFGYYGHGTEDFTPEAREGEGMRYLNFKRWLTEIKNTFDVGIDEIIYEDVKRHLSAASAHAFGGYRATMMLWAEHHKIAYTPVGVMVLKKAFAGHGHASKEDMIRTVAEKMKITALDDNEADALAILWWAQQRGGL